MKKFYRLLRDSWILIERISSDNYLYFVDTAGNTHDLHASANQAFYQALADTRVSASDEGDFVSPELWIHGYRSSFLFPVFTRESNVELRPQNFVCISVFLRQAFIPEENCGPRLPGSHLIYGQ